MKNSINIMFLLLLMVLAPLAVFGQQQSKIISHPTPLEVAWDKTTVLVLDGNILSVDRGSKALLAQKDAAASNILKLKGGKRYFENTNLHVVTDQGLVYKFEVQYSDYPMKTTYDLMQSEKLTLDFPHDQADFLNCVNQIIGNPMRSIKKQRKHRMAYHLFGIYQKDGVLYFQLGLENQSNIPFEIEEINAVIRDKKQVKRTSVREDFIPQRYEYLQQGSNLSSKDTKVMVLAYPQFTIADKKQLHLLLHEEKGDRNMSLKIKGKRLLKAKRLYDINH
ncbi:conjugative transposon protein TraN [Belliella aquatica]|uniref:Conjugative transposon protein TraN n=1 Tax=Belliella aquatica TaxID=1323734 RepID=A0ABQ1LZQ1_9BACT|nr:conjugative transposon protein TraN [Belliella aquatica]MCH7406852.1 conjugative transposon protein TraN [Belliella aquatica]GGC32203.1 conjugative transposon protein TraN [Belliella aquatica]